MAICEYCNSKLNGDEKFCTGCGAPVPEIPVQEEPQPTYTAETTESTTGSWGQAAVAGMGASILGSLLRGAARSSMYRSMHRPTPPPMGGMYHCHGNPGHRGGFGGHGGFGGPGGPGRGHGGHRGGFGGPGGHRGGPR